MISLSKQTTIPIAKLHCVFESNIGTDNAFKSYFDQRNLVLETFLTIGAKVMLTSNYEPIWGLYNGAMGIVIDIMYDNFIGPHHKRDHLPKYVVVDIPCLKLPSFIPPWDNNNPSVSYLSLFYMLCCNLFHFYSFHLFYLLLFHFFSMCHFHHVLYFVREQFHQIEVVIAVVPNIFL